MSSAAESNPVRSIVDAFEATVPAAKKSKKQKELSARAKKRERQDQSPESSDQDPPKTIAWASGFWLIGLHIGALAAPWFFTWEALATMLVLHWFNGCIGITLGFHRLLTHSSFKTYKPVKWAFAFIGGLAGEGPAIDWVANHRKHHAHSDQEGDPHSPHDGAWWSHMFWLAKSYHGKALEAHSRRWAPDLAKDPVMRWIGYMFIPSHFLVGALLMGFGYWLGGTHMAISFLVYAVFLRLVLVLHATWLVNSASHMWGYRNYETTDDSRNNWWVALVTYGEGWHNNHHAYPRMAPHGHKWWEIDVTYTMIRMLKACGLAWDVVDYKQKTLGGAEQ
ncbi:MAG TPA: fatty acid desaturase [Pirellulaceae bacterium]|nr:fatty acid desaturase [Pirellulaceae bacterium]